MNEVAHNAHLELQTDGAAARRNRPDLRPARSTHLTPHFQLDLSRTAASDQINFWQTIAPRAYRVRGRGGDAITPLDVLSSVWSLDPLLVTRFSSRAHFVAKTTANKKSRSPFVKVRLFERGGARFFADRAPINLGPRAVYIIDQSREWICHFDDHEQLNVFIPHAAIGFDPARHPVCSTFGLDQPEGHILANALQSLLAELPTVAQEQAPVVASGFSGLVHGLLRGALASSSQREIQKARLGAMRQYLDCNLGDHDLGLESLSRVFGSARATIFRDFADEGGVARYIWRRRLEEAFEELANHPGRRGLVRVIAERWCFASVGHFSEAFFRQFGVRPTEVIGLWKVPPPSPVSKPADKVRMDPEPALADMQSRLAAVYARFTD